MIARLTASATTPLVPASNRWRIQGTPMSPFWQSRNWVKTTRTTLTTCLSRILMELQHILLEFRMWKQADAPTSTLCSPPPPTPTPMEGWHAMTTKDLKWWRSRWRTPWSVLAPLVPFLAVAMLMKVDLLLRCFVISTEKWPSFTELEWNQYVHMLYHILYHQISRLCDIICEIEANSQG